MTALLTDNLPLLAGAPNGIKKLRELILELAVRGKLVPQDANDEPASELLRRIAEEKARSVVAGKKVKQEADINGKEQPFSIPQGWSWVRLGSCLEMINGRAFKPTEWIAAGLPIVRIQNLNKPDAPFNYCDTDTVDDRHIIDTGTILISWSGTPGTSFGAFIWERGKAALNQHIFSCSQVGDAFFDKFLKLAINTRLEELIAKAHGGVGLQHVTKGKLEALTLVLPPLAEQHRIVAKVDELMALCDRLEARQTDADSAHAQLVQALLDSLTQARDAEDFAQSWQRLAEHFHTLFTTESSIDALRQTLLQLAVMGKLVPHGINDEENSELPAGWSSYKIGEFCTVQGGIQKTPLRRPVSQHFPYLRVANVQRGRIDIRELERYELSLDELEKWRLNAGDLLIVEGNGSESEIGRCAIWQGEVENCVYQNHLMRVRPQICEQVEYLALYLNSPIGMAHMRRLALTTSGLFNLSVGKIRSIPVALPPLEEQHRIVAKVDQLMALCDQLKVRLNQACQVHEQLANALVKRALVEDRQQSPVATDRKVARSLLAAEITHQLHGQRTFGQRKLQKVIYLAEHAARLDAIQGSYLRNVAGPHDRQLMREVEDELHNHQWYQRIERDAVGHAYRPLAAAGQHQQEYESAWPAAARAAIQQVIDRMRSWDTDRCERVVTLYAAWNDFLLEGRAVTDEALVTDVMYSWNDAKLRFTQAQWLAELSEMKKYELLTPSGFGKRTQGGLQTLPGLH